MGEYSVIIIIVLVWTGLTIVGKWKVYTKAMEPGWASLIPLYSTYVMFRICWNTHIFWVYLAATILSSMLRNVNSPGAVIIGLLGGLVNLVINCMLLYRLSKSFGHGIGFAVGLYMIPSVFLMILGFGSSEYDSSYEMSSI